MTDEIRARLDEIKARLEKATKGPWVDMSTANDVRPIVSAETGDEICCDPEFDDREADRDFITEGRSDIPWLISLVESLKEALQNRNDLLRSFAITARMTQLAGDASVLARDIVAVVAASDVPEE